MTLYSSIFLFLILGIIGVCADGDPMLQNVLRKLSELTSTVQEQNEKIIQLQQIVKTQGCELETLRSTVAQSHHKDTDDRTSGSNKSDNVTLTTAPPTKLYHRWFVAYYFRSWRSPLRLEMDSYHLCAIWECISFNYKTWGPWRHILFFKHIIVSR